MTTSDGSRAGQIEGRVAEWVTTALTAGATDGTVGVEATAKRAAALPDDGLEVRPEDWAVRVVLTFAEADPAAAADIVGGVADGTSTVTLQGGEAAEITWPADVAADPGDPLRYEVAVQVTIPWPSRNDAAAESA